MESATLQSVVEQNPPPSHVDGTRVFCHPRIPDDLLQNARASFAKIGVDETPLVCVDLVSRGFFAKLLSKPGSKGLLLTDKAIYDGSRWESEVYMPPRDKRSIPLALIQDTRVGGAWTAENAVLVNGMPLFGWRPAFDGVRDVHFTSWFSHLLALLVSKVRGHTEFVLKDLVMSYQGMLASERVFGCGDLHYGDAIPPDLWRNATATFVRTDGPEEQPLFLYNDGGKGASGVVITDRNLFAHAGGHDFFFKWPLSAIQKVWVGYYSARRSGYVHVFVNDARVYGWPHLTDSNSIGYLAAPVFTLANLICAIARGLGQCDVESPTTWLGVDAFPLTATEGVRYRGYIKKG